MFPSLARLVDNAAAVTNAQLPDGSNDKCVICLDTLDASLDDLKALKCEGSGGTQSQHQFHLQCIAVWAENALGPDNPSCPICRTEMTDEETVDLQLAMMPAPPPAPQLPAPRPPRPLSQPPGRRTARRPPRTKAFLYVVVRNLGFSTARPGHATIQGGPHVFLMGHRHRTGARRWGVPGGLGDRGDSDSVHTAVREFAEETGLVSTVRRNQKQMLIAELRRIFTRRGLYTAIPTNTVGYSAHVVIFDSAVQFERETGLIGLVRTLTGRRAPSANDKYNMALSRETQGFTYVPLQPIPLPPLKYVLQPATPVPGARFVESSVKLAKYGGKKVELRLRHGIANSALRSAIASL